MNVLVHFLSGDDPKQASIARSLFAAGPIWIGKTVSLETAWVLESVYAFAPVAVHDALNRLLRLANVFAEPEQSGREALSLYAGGLDFANALRLSGRPHYTPFVSFDRATRAGATQISNAV